MNIIEIRGIRGLITVGMIACCLIAGFVAFPGLVCMYLWNCASSYSLSIPTISLFQGILLWAIMVTSYFVFSKNKVVVCLKSPKGLTDEELKKVFANIKKQSELDPVLQSMIKAKETELRLKNAEETSENKQEETPEIHNV